MKSAPLPSSSFLYVICQVGAERALKGELARRWPEMRLAFSRPGFLTFKLPAEFVPSADFDLESTFARAYGFSLGKIAVETSEAAAREAWRLAGYAPYAALHVWQRDAAKPGYRGFEPGITSAAIEAEVALQAVRAEIAPEAPALNSGAAPLGSLVLDCVLVEPAEWWIGYHWAHGGASSRAGGFYSEIVAPADVISRAYLKISEALAWSELPIKKGDAWVEIGCSPGGASQALLERGMKVTGIDPAEVDERLLSHPNFTHVRKRGADVRRREFRHFRWLAIDINVAPNYTLDTVEAIVTHPTVKLHGLILTLKFLEWEMADDLPEYLARIAGWKFPDIRARQLGHNRQEICVVATRGAKSSGGGKRRGKRPARRKSGARVPKERGR